MDFNKVLATIWYYMYPILFTGSLILFFLSFFIRQKSKRWDFVNTFSRVFLLQMLLSYFYHLYLAFTKGDHLKRFGFSEYFENFMPIGESFYFWAYYLAFYFAIVSILLTLGLYFYQKKIKKI